MRRAGVSSAHQSLGCPLASSALELRTASAAASGKPSSNDLGAPLQRISIIRRPTASFGVRSLHPGGQRGAVRSAADGVEKPAASCPS